MDPQDNELHQIDNLEHKLYDPKQQDAEVNFHHIRDHRVEELPTNWGDSTPIIRPAEKETGYSLGTKVLFAALTILCLTLIFTAWRVLSSRNVVSASSIDLTIDSKPYVDGGEVTPFSVSVLNRNTTALEEAVITLTYEKGIGVQNEQAKVSEKRDLGTIAPNTLKKEDMTVTLYGAEGDARTLSVRLEYKVAGANAVFEKTVTTSVVLKTPPLALHIQGPTSLVQGQEGMFTISVSNNTNAEITNSLVAVSLPTTFTLRTSSPAAGRGLVWTVPSVMPGATSTIKLYGSFTGEPGEADTIKASVGSPGDSLNQIGVVYSQEVHGVSITAPLLSLVMRLETDRGNASSLRYGDKASIYITYQNKSDKPISSASVVATITGTAPIIPSITSDAGYYNSINHTVTWNSATNPELASIPPGGTGELRLYIPIVNRGTNSPQLNLTIDGVATSITKDDTATQIAKSWSVQGSATLSAWTAYRTAAFDNSGPLPPKANVDTTYDAHLVASAQNALSNTRVSFILPAYVTYTGVYLKGSNVTYDDRSRTVVWNIGGLGGGQVATTDIQLRVRPSTSHVGLTPPITSGITLEGDEIDSKAHIRTAIGGLTTELTKEGGPTDVSHVLAE